MTKQDMILLVEIYEVLPEMEKILTVLIGESIVPTLNVGVMGKLAKLEDVIANCSLEELATDCVNDTYCSAIHILNDSTLDAETKVAYLTGEIPIKYYKYKIDEE